MDNFAEKTVRLAKEIIVHREVGNYDRLFGEITKALKDAYNEGIEKAAITVKSSNSLWKYHFIEEIRKNII